MNREQERAIEWDCFHTQNKYYVMVDAGDYEGGGNLFTEDAIWTLWGLELQGRAEIIKGLPRVLVQYLSVILCRTSRSI